MWVGSMTFKYVKSYSMGLPNNMGISIYNSHIPAKLGNLVQ